MGVKYQINYKILAENHPNWGNANNSYQLTLLTKKKKLSPAEQAKLYRKLLDSGKTENSSQQVEYFMILMILKVRFHLFVIGWISINTHVIIQAQFRKGTIIMANSSVSGIL